MNIEFRPVTDAEKDLIKKGFEAHNTSQGQSYEPENFSFVALEDGVFCGAVYGHIVWDWMYVDILFVEEAQRGNAIGTHLLKAAEALAAQKNLVGLYLSTQSWQARDFYTKMGFEEYAALKDFPRGFTRYEFRKYL